MPLGQNLPTMRELSWPIEPCAPSNAYIAGLVVNYGISNTNKLEIPQCTTKAATQWMI